jgi:DNA polymerase V
MEGDALQAAGIFDQDLLVVDRSLYAADGALVVVSLNGHLMARFYSTDAETLYLLPANPAYEPITVLSPERYMYEVWGVVVGVVRRLHRRR